MQNVEIAPFQIIGLAIRTTNEHGKAATDIAELWNQFLSENIMSKIPNKIGSDIYSLYTDYEGDHTYPYTALLGCRVTDLQEIPEGLAGRSFPGGLYQKTTAHGDLEQGLVVNHWSKIWGMEIDRTYTVDFEVFGPKAMDPSNAEVDFYVGVKSNGSE